MMIFIEASLYVNCVENYSYDSSYKTLFTFTSIFINVC